MQINDLLRGDLIMGWIKALLSLLVLVLVFLWAVSFRAENTDPVSLSLVFIRFDALSISIWVTLSFCVGVLIGILAMVPLIARIKTRLFQLNRQVKSAK